MRSAATGLALAVAMLVAPGVAQAVTRCVGSPSGCAGTSYAGTPTGLQSALTDAQGGGDSVRIGVGTYTAPSIAGFHYNGNDVQISGDGPGTIIQPAALNGAAGLDVNAGGTANSLVSDLLVQLQPVNNQNGFFLTSVVASNVRVTGVSPPASNANVGVHLDGHARFEKGEIDVPGEFLGIESAGAGNDVADSTINAIIGVSTDVNMSVDRSRITADREGLDVGGATVTVTTASTLIHISGNTSFAGDGVRAFSGGTINATNLTVIGDAAADHGLRASQSGAGTATVNVDSSIVLGFGQGDLYTDTSGSGSPHGNINADYSRVGTTDDTDGGQVALGPGVVSATPSFVNQPLGDYRLRFDSPLIDKGKPGAPSGTTDLGGLTRLVHGIVDMGAFEYQRLPPSARILGPDSGQPGEALVFSSRSTDPDPGDPLSFAWTLPDQPTLRSTSSDATVTRSFDKPGKYPVSLTVTDPTGQTSSASQEVTIADTLIPALTDLGLTNSTFRVDSKGAVVSRRAKKGTKFRFTLTEAARVTFTIARRSKGRKVGSKCRKPTRRLRKRKACIRYVKVKSFTRNGKAGANRVPFSGRIRLKGKKRKLRPARYRATLQAKDAAGNRSDAGRVAFRIVR